MPKPIKQLTSVVKDGNGHVQATLDGAEVVDLNTVQHLEVRILDIPKAILTLNIGFTFQYVTPETMYEILIPGIPANYGFPPYGSQFNVVVGCNQP